MVFKGPAPKTDEYAVDFDFGSDHHKLWSYQPDQILGE